MKDSLTIAKAFFLFLFVLASFFPLSFAQANHASLFFYPENGSFENGKIFSVNIKVHSADQSINAVTGDIYFSKEKLEVVSISKTGSLVNLWVKEPSFSNNDGRIDFEGILFNPGFQGDSGNILTINFKAIAEGDTSVFFNSGRVLANDGEGTDLADNLGRADFKVTAKSASSASGSSSSYSFVKSVPAQPIIRSSTHPDQGKWYSTSDASFSWDLPSDVLAVKILLSEKPGLAPSVSYVPPIASRELKDLQDGVWYFYVSLKNDIGWSDVSAFRFNIDTNSPENFSLKEIERDDPTYPRVKFELDAFDETSGIDHFSIKIDKNKEIIWKDDESHIYETPALDIGEHVIIIKAVDKAGHYLVDTSQVKIEALNAPVLHGHEGRLDDQDDLIIKGISDYSNANIVVNVQKSDGSVKEYRTETGDEGDFSVIIDSDPEPGVYKYKLSVVDKRGAKSESTEEHVIIVEKPWLIRVGESTINFLSIVVMIIALLVVLGMLIYFILNKIKYMKAKIGSDVQRSELSVHEFFESFRNELLDDIDDLNRKKEEAGLSSDEEKVLERLKRRLDGLEKNVDNEFEFIKKDIEN